MRKLLISILLAGAAASPAFAEPWHRNNDGDNSNRPQAHEQHQQAHDEGRAARFNGGGDNGQRPRFEMRQQVQQQDAYRGGGGFDRSRFEGRANVAPQQVQVQQQAFDRRGGNFDGYRRDRVEQAPRQVETQRDYYRRDRSGWTGGQAVQVQQYDRSGSWARDRGSWSQDRDGDYRQREQARSGSRWASGGWNRDWRNDRRYDWRRYRDQHRSVFHLGIYYDPFGYGYQPFGIGYRLTPAYFGNQYWIDPGLYGLPYPPPGAQWVRYWNDAVLVDMYTGEVIDVIRDFFW